MAKQSTNRIEAKKMLDSIYPCPRGDLDRAISSQDGLCLIAFTKLLKMLIVSGNTDKKQNTKQNT